MVAMAASYLLSYIDYIRTTFNTCSTDIRMEEARNWKKGWGRGAFALCWIHQCNTNIEKIQRRAARWFINDYSRYSSVKSMLQQLQWPTLEERRNKSRLSLLYKAKNNLIALEIPSYYQQRHDETRLHHQSSYILPYIRTSSHINSFYPKTINQWNALPAHAISSNSLTEFQNNI